MIYFLGLILHPQRVLRQSAIDDEMEKLEDRKQREIQEIDTSENESSDIPPEDDGTPMDVIKDEVRPGRDSPAFQGAASSQDRGLA